MVNNTARLAAERTTFIDRTRPLPSAASSVPRVTSAVGAATPPPGGEGGEVVLYGRLAAAPATLCPATAYLWLVRRLVQGGARICRHCARAAITTLSGQQSDVYEPRRVAL